MFKIQENPPFLFPFSFSFPTGKLKQQRNFICQIHFHLKIRYLLATLFLLSHSVFQRISQISRGLTYAYLFSVLKWEKPSPFSDIDFFLIMFSLNLLSICSMCMVCQPSVPWSAHTTDSCCPPPSSAVAVCLCNHYQHCHCHQPVTAIIRICNLLLLPPFCSSWDIKFKVPFTKA